MIRLGGTYLGRDRNIYDLQGCLAIGGDRQRAPVDIDSAVVMIDPILALQLDRQVTYFGGGNLAARVIRQDQRTRVLIKLRHLRIIRIKLR